MWIDLGRVGIGWRRGVAGCISGRYRWFLFGLGDRLGCHIGALVPCSSTLVEHQAKDMNALSFVPGHRTKSGEG